MSARIQHSRRSEPAGSVLSSCPEGMSMPSWYGVGVTLNLGPEGRGTSAQPTRRVRYSTVVKGCRRDFGGPKIWGGRTQPNNAVQFATPTRALNLAVFWITGGVPVTLICREGGLERHTGRVQAFWSNAEALSARSPTGTCVAVVVRVERFWRTASRATKQMPSLVVSLRVRRWSGLFCRGRGRLGGVLKRRTRRGVSDQMTSPVDRGHTDLLRCSGSPQG